MPSEQPPATDFDRAFRNMCHSAVIATASNAQESIERLLLRVILVDGREHRTPQDLQEGLTAQFGLKASMPLVQAAASALEDSGRLRVVNGAYALEASAAEAERIAAKSVEDLEARVLNEWHSQILNRAGEQLTTATYGTALNSLLARLLRRHGVQAVEVIYPSGGNTVDLDLSVSEMVREEAARAGGHRDSEQIEAALRLFLEGAPSSPDRLSYIAMLADTAFSYFAVSVPPEAAQAFRKRLSDVIVFFDTNALFGIAELNADIRDAVRRVARLAKDDGLPLLLRFHQVTLDEFNRTVQAQADVLSEATSSTASKALLSYGVFENVVQRRYHELNAEDSITVQDFKERLRNAPHAFDAVGLKIYREDWMPPDVVAEIERQYTRALEERYSARHIPDNQQKSLAGLKHDAYLIALTYEVRRRATDAGKFGALLLTLDNSLIEFDRSYQRRIRSDGTAPERCVVGPDTLLQIMRLFSPVDERSQYDAEFARAIAAPYFRVQSGAAAKAVQQIAGVVSRYGDLPVEAAEVVLASDALHQRIMRGAGEDEIAKEVEGLLGAQLRELQEDSEKAHGEVSVLQRRVATLEQEQLTKVERLELLQRQLDEDAEVKNRVADEASTLASERDSLSGRLAELEDANVQLRRALTVVTGTLTAISTGLLVWFLLPTLSPYFTRLALRLVTTFAAAVIVASVAIAVREPRARLWLTGIVIGTLVTTAITHILGLVLSASP